MSWILHFLHGIPFRRITHSSEIRAFVNILNWNILENHSYAVECVQHIHWLMSKIALSKTFAKAIQNNKCIIQIKCYFTCAFGVGAPLSAFLRCFIASQLMVFSFDANKSIFINMYHVNSRLNMFHLLIQRAVVETPCLCLSCWRHTDTDTITPSFIVLESQSPAISTQPMLNLNELKYDRLTQSCPNWMGFMHGITIFCSPYTWRCI